MKWTSYIRHAPMVLCITLLFGVSATAQASCSSEFCSINTSLEASGAGNEPGGRISLRYEFIDQDQPRSGSNKVAVGEISRHHDEVRTINRNLIAGMDYTFTPTWGISVQAPLLSRSHDHIHNHHGAKLPEQWRFTELGDLRVLGRYQFLSSPDDKRYAGIRMGLKLPTGDFNVKNAGGKVAERSLQPGTGTTDLLLGAYFGGSTGNDSLSWFIQGLRQQPLSDRSRYKPGAQTSLDIGFNYAVSSHLHGLLQLNTHVKGRDGGANAEPVDTGGTFVSLSPGLSYDVSHDLQVYGFFQQSLYQNVNGVQLTADWSAIMGVSRSF